MFGVVFLRMKCLKIVEDFEVAEVLVAVLQEASLPGRHEAGSVLEALVAAEGSALLA